MTRRSEMGARRSQHPTQYHSTTVSPYHDTTIAQSGALTRVDVPALPRDSSETSQEQRCQLAMSSTWCITSSRDRTKSSKRAHTPAQDAPPLHKRHNQPGAVVLRTVSTFPLPPSLIFSGTTSWHCSMPGVRMIIRVSKGEATGGNRLPNVKVTHYCGRKVRARCTEAGSRVPAGIKLAD